MVRLRLALVCTLGVLLVTPQGAAGGGWWSNIDVDRSVVTPGQGVEVETGQVAFSSTAAAKQAARGGRFYVYLLRDFDYAVVERAMGKADPRNWWSLNAAEAIQVGQVTVKVSDANLGKATAAFTVPQLPPGTYHLMLCDAGCTEPLPDVIPAKGFTVVADPATAQLAQRLDSLARRIQSQADQLATARADADRALVAAQSAHSEVEQLKASVSSLANDGRSSPLAAPWAYAGWLVAGALAGGLVLLVLRRRRSQPSRPARVAGWHASDEELQELLSSESDYRR
jgi:hypothetical protein